MFPSPKYGVPFHLSGASVKFCIFLLSGLMYFVVFIPRNCRPWERSLFSHHCLQRTNDGFRETPMRSRLLRLESRQLINSLSLMDNRRPAAQLPQPPTPPTSCPLPSLAAVRLCPSVRPATRLLKCQTWHHCTVARDPPGGPGTKAVARLPPHGCSSEAPRLPPTGPRLTSAPRVRDLPQAKFQQALRNLTLPSAN